MKTSTTFSFLASLAAVSAAQCPAPGTTNSAGDYPGQACALLNGCHYLRGLGLMTSTASATATSTAASTTTATCPPPGQTNAAGDYSCNPAHDYPGEACALIGGCYFLRGLGVMTSSTVSAPAPAATCPPPGQTNAAGEYSCNPAHDYPGQACALIGDCYFLRGLGLLTSTASAPAPHPTCPPAGACNAAGDTSCNPALQYPGQACVLMNGCYFLRGLNGNVTFTVPPPGPKPTSLVPATSKGAPVTTAPSKPTAVVTAGASHLTSFGGLAVIGLVAALL
ncbi:hypothetical protein NLU13_2849 [Sarocladium strictum]|uniref:Uncharacterized protein n=1 Tax=Sarocladium strictum TaxID=5046 RepID=A0AA39GMQ6_SARSR|nr:hypothetical protein NLU13_2849 [Sarocladium strictum]